MSSIVSHTKRPARAMALVTGSTSVRDWTFHVACTEAGICSIGLPGRVTEYHEWLHRNIDAQFHVTVAGHETAAENAWTTDNTDVRRATRWFHEAARWLREYGSGVQGPLPDLVLVGTDFQQKVWRELLQIPRGKTCSYQDVAAAIGKPRAVRAVGRAVGANPLAVMVPCHRVIGANGQLVGFAGGLPLKKQLLESEVARQETG